MSRWTERLWVAVLVLLGTGLLVATMGLEDPDTISSVVVPPWVYWEWRLRGRVATALLTMATAPSKVRCAT
jgi:hypothetical protein